MPSQQDPNPKERYISAEVLRREFSPSPSLRTIRTWTAARIIPSVRIGGRVYYDRVAITDKIENRLTVRVRAENRKRGT